MTTSTARWATKGIQDDVAAMNRSHRTTPAARTRAAAAIADACVSPSDPMDLLERLVRSMRSVMAFDGVFVTATDPATTVFATASLIDGLPWRMCAPFMENEFLVDDFNKFADLHHAGGSPTTLHRATLGRPQRSARHVGVNTPEGIGPELRATFSTQGSCWGVINLVRDAAASDFDDDDLAFIATISREVAAGLRRSVLTTRPRVLDDQLPGPGVITMDGDGRVTGITDRAADLLTQLRGLHPISDGLGLPLPGEVYVVGARARARAKGRPGPAPVARVRSSSGGWLTLRGDCIRGMAGAVASTTVVIDRSRPSEVIPLVVAAYELTAREEDVLAEVVRGHGTAEIAARLFISPHTVRDHVKSILEKAGVASRGELVSKLFSLHYRPGTDLVHR